MQFPPLLLVVAFFVIAASGETSCIDYKNECRGCLGYQDAVGRKACYWCKMNATHGLCSDNFDNSVEPCPGGKSAITSESSDCVEVTSTTLIIAVVGGVVGACLLVGCYQYMRSREAKDPVSNINKEENMRRKEKQAQNEHETKHREFKVVKDRDGNQRLVIIDHDEEVKTSGSQLQGPRWKCSRCSTNNNNASVKCSGCGNKRPGSSGAPQQLREPPPGVKLPPGTRLGMDGTVYKEDGWVVIGKLKVLDEGEDDEGDYGEGPGEGGYGGNGAYGEQHGEGGYR